MSEQVWLPKLHATYLINRKSLVIVDCSDLEGFGKVNNWAFLNVDDVEDRDRDFNAITVIVRSEDDLLQRFDPFFRTRVAICFERIRPALRRDQKM